MAIFPNTDFLPLVLQAHEMSMNLRCALQSTSNQSLCVNRGAQSPFADKLAKPDNKAEAEQIEA
jgi:hypothetical protein